MSLKSDFTIPNILNFQREAANRKIINIPDLSRPTGVINDKRSKKP